MRNEISKSREDLRVVGDGIDEEVLESWEDDEGEAEWKDEEDGESEEVTRVSVDYALCFGEDCAHVENWWSRWRW